MTRYYIAFATRSQAFLVERRMKNEGIACELSYMPREIMRDLCNMGIRFEETQLRMAMDVLRRSGVPGCRLYREVLQPGGSSYIEVKII